MFCLLTKEKIFICFEVEILPVKFPDFFYSVSKVEAKHGTTFGCII